ncbi:MAG: chromate transporter [Alicyclobacillaceae bacterium]|nr:chromate transporter [Alicyclobacillaceae bacterium]
MAAERPAPGGAGPYLDLVAAMVRTGLLGYGGGPSVIPLFRYEAVDRYGWMSDEEFGEILALANALPGPIATKLAAYLGYRLKGTAGATVAVLAHILPTSIAMVGLLGILYALRHSKVVEGMIDAVRPVIVVLLGLMAFEFVQKAGKGLGSVPALAFGLAALAALAVADVHPALVILAALVYGPFHLRVAARLKEWRERRGSRRREGPKP